MNKIVLASLSLLAASISPVAMADNAADAPVQFLNSASSAAANLPFSDAVRVGDMLFLSGQIGVDPETDVLVSGGIKPEARQTMENIRSSLKTYGYAMSDVIKCTVMLADMSEWQAFNEIYVSFFPKPYPARGAFGATGLALHARVEVECIAVPAHRS